MKININHNYGNTSTGTKLEDIVAGAIFVFFSDMHEPYIRGDINDQGFRCIKISNMLQGTYGKETPVKLIRHAVLDISISGDLE